MTCKTCALEKALALAASASLDSINGDVLDEEGDLGAA